MPGQPWIYIGLTPLSGRRLLPAGTGHVHYHRIRFLGATSDDNHQVLGFGGGYFLVDISWSSNFALDRIRGRLKQ